MTFAPDPTITDIAADLQTIIVNGLGFDSNLVFPEEPDGPPPDGSTLILFRQFDVKDDTNGKMYLKLTYVVQYLLVPSVNRNSRATLNSLVLPFLLSFEDWANQSLNGDYMQVGAQKGGVGRVAYSDQPYDALTVFVTVDTEFNIPLS